MLSQLQLINKILQDKDFSVITLNNLNDSFFFNYKAEFNYIKTHYEQYKTIPDKLTFLNVFPDFDIQEVQEPNSFLLEELYKDYNHAYLAHRFNKIKEFLEQDQVDKASEYFKQSIEGFHTGMAMTCTDLSTDLSRFDRYEDRTANQAKYYLRTGFNELDLALSGTSTCGGIDRENENMIIMARPGIGKTQVLLEMATAAANQGLVVGIYEGEMTADKVGYRIDTFAGHISNKAMNKGYSDIHASYAEYVKNIANYLPSPVKVLTQNDVPSGEVTVDVLKAFIEQQHLDILFIDQYDLMEDNGDSKAEYERIGHIAKMIKKLQVEKKIPMIAVCQMNRTKNEDGSQDTTQAAGSDKISRYATIMIALEQKQEEGSKQVILNLNIIKARDGCYNSKLSYYADFDIGKFYYIPSEKDNITTEQDAKNIAQSYAPLPTDDGVIPF